MGFFGLIYQLWSKKNFSPQYIIVIDHYRFKNLIYITDFFVFFGVGVVESCMANTLRSRTRTISVTRHQEPCMPNLSANQRKKNTEIDIGP